MGFKLGGFKVWGSRIRAKGLGFSEAAAWQVARIMSGFPKTGPGNPEDLFSLHGDSIMASTAATGTFPLTSDYL